MKNVVEMLGCDSSTGFMQTKWDGAPAVICGEHPFTGQFFVGTKSVFNKTEPKICWSEGSIDEYYQGDLAEKLKFSLKYFAELDIKGVIQGDLMFTNSTIKTETINKEKLYTFRPNTITERMIG